MADFCFQISPPKKITRKEPRGEEEAEEEEEIVLKPFAPKPRISFGRIKLGQSVSKILKVCNPKDYDDHVSITSNPEDSELVIDSKEIFIPAKHFVEIKFSWKPLVAKQHRLGVQFNYGNNQVLQGVLLCLAYHPDTVKKKGNKVVRKHNSAPHFNSRPLTELNRERSTLKERSKNRPSIKSTKNSIKSKENFTVCKEKRNGSAKSNNKKPVAFNSTTFAEAEQTLTPNTYVKHRSPPLLQISAIPSLDFDLNRLPTDKVEEFVVHQDGASPYVNFDLPISADTPIRRETYITGEVIARQRDDAQTPYSSKASSIRRGLKNLMQWLSADSDEQTLASSNQGDEIKHVEAELPLNSSQPLIASSPLDLCSKSTDICSPKHHAETFTVKGNELQLSSSSSEECLLETSSVTTGSQKSDDHSTKHYIKVASELKFKRNPYITRNEYYDPDWISKQTYGLQQLLNFVLTPPAEMNFSAINMQETIDRANLQGALMSSTYIAPTKEVLSYKAYSAGKYLNNLRRKFCKLYESGEVVKVIKKVEEVVECESIKIRPDRDVHKDIGLKKSLLKLLMSYNPLWLRVSLETIYGELIHLSSSSDVLGLMRFLMRRWLTDPHLVEKFSYSRVKLLYKDAYVPAIKKFILKMFLKVVFVLDLAKSRRLIDYDPCLFLMDSPFKRSKDVLTAFCRDFLYAEGDLIKHLKAFGYVVAVEQTHLDEYEYAVKDLRTDLRCGIRLTRAVEMIYGCQLRHLLRVPAISLLQKTHNTRLAFNVLSEKGVPTVGITPKHIVDGHIINTLKLLWSLFFHFEIRQILSKDVLRAEISHLKTIIRIKKVVMRPIPQLDLSGYDDSLCLLLEWCHLISCIYNLKITNFTSSFADGSVLCAIVHFYHPDLIKEQHVLVGYEGGIQGDFLFRSHVSNNDSRLELGKMAKRWSSFKSAVASLGSIPLLVTEDLSLEQTPDEKVMMCQLSYLCSRLLSISAEVRAARMIQTYWRRYAEEKARKREEEIKEFTERCRRRKEETMALVIQRWFRSIKAKILLRSQIKAACKIQAWFRRLRATRSDRGEYRLLRQKTCFVQRHFRSKLLAVSCRRRFLEVRNATITIQRWFMSMRSGQEARENYITLRLSTVKIQRWFRGIVLVNRQKQSFRMQKQSAIVIQRWYRHCRMVHRQAMCAVVLQRWYRNILAGRQCRRNYIDTHKKIVIIQIWWRACVLSRKRQLSCMKIQAWWRMMLKNRGIRHQYLITRSSTLKIQAWYRNVLVSRAVRRQHLALRTNAIKIQTWYRALLLRKRLDVRVQEEVKSAVIIQRWYRVQRHSKRNFAAIIIQKYVRRYLVKKDFSRMKQSCIVVQRYLRRTVLSKRQRRLFLTQKSAAIVIQRSFRKYVEIKRKVTQSRAATVIQKYIRRYLAIKKRKRLQHAKWLDHVRFYADCLHRLKLLEDAETKKKNEAALKIQCCYRRYRAGLILKELKKEKRLSIIQKNICAFKIFTWYKNMLKNRQMLLEKKQAAVRIQSVWRSYIIRKSEDNCRLSEIRSKLRRLSIEQTEEDSIAHKIAFYVKSMANTDFKTAHDTWALNGIDKYCSMLPYCCVYLAECDIVSRLMTMILSFNRSLPHMHALSVILNIFLSLAKYKPTLYCLTRTNQWIDTITTIISKHYMNSVPLLIKAVCLMYLIVSVEENKKLLVSDETAMTIMMNVYTYWKNKKNRICDSAKKPEKKQSIRRKLRMMGFLKPKWIMSIRNDKEMNDAFFVLSSLMDEIQ